MRTSTFIEQVNAGGGPAIIERARQAYLASAESARMAKAQMEMLAQSAGVNLGRASAAHELVENLIAQHESATDQLNVQGALNQAGRVAVARNLAGRQAVRDRANAERALHVTTAWLAAAEGWRRATRAATAYEDHHRRRQADPALAEETTRWLTAGEALWTHAQRVDADPIRLNLPESLSEEKTQAIAAAAGVSLDGRQIPTAPVINGLGGQNPFLVPGHVPWSEPKAGLYGLLGFGEGVSVVYDPTAAECDWWCKLRAAFVAAGPAVGGASVATGSQVSDPTARDLLRSFGASILGFSQGLGAKVQSGFAQGHGQVTGSQPVPWLALFIAVPVAILGGIAVARRLKKE